MNNQLFRFGNWIYFDKVTGEILHETGEVWHSDPEYENKRNPFSNIPKLMERIPESVGIIKLKPDELEQDFAEGFLGRVNPETLELEFVYLDPANPGIPQEPRKPLSVEVEELRQENTLLKAQNSALTERTEFIEDVIAEMAIQVYQ
ncbi:hypothetical protein M2277_005172 [Paenibacillus sp. LBL]|uniref:hypothetical protein n=1 Tax=Paenibacillus sp. LBL TaxID=2940563 RepID=UPI0024754A4D|nr:hypothetical protein [Paenibacillus sp. LBL]MDH6674476.1 hypothetical protein [Paenibacillus sp. LBL]